MKTALFSFPQLRRNCEKIPCFSLLLESASVVAFSSLAQMCQSVLTCSGSSPFLSSHALPLTLSSSLSTDSTNQARAGERRLAMNGRRRPPHLPLPFPLSPLSLPNHKAVPTHNVWLLRSNFLMDELIMRRSEALVD